MKFKELKKKIKELLDLIIGDCGNCEFFEECCFRKRGKTSCWEQGKGSYYKRKK